MNSDEEALFFEDPKVYRYPPGNFGVLYLLRRDIDQCLTHSILWPGAMAIMAGIDLLAKFECGDDPGGVGRRFRGFVERYLHLSAPDSELMYLLRNSLLHSFGLYSESRGVVRRFRLTANQGAPLIAGPTKSCVDLFALDDSFEKALGEYRARLQGDAALQSQFALMFPKYGAVPIEHGPEDLIEVPAHVLE